MDSEKTIVVQIICQIVNTRKQRGLPTYVSFVDFSKAFDRVDHNTL